MGGELKREKASGGGILGELYIQRMNKGGLHEKRKRRERTQRPGLSRTFKKGERLGKDREGGTRVEYPRISLGKAQRRKGSKHPRGRGKKGNSTLRGVK